MKVRDLTAEALTAASRVGRREFDRLASLGVSPVSIADVGSRHVPFGIVNAEVLKHGFYQPGAGAAHIVQPVFSDGGIIDLVAWRSLTPSRWNLRTGLGWLMGIDEVSTVGGWDASRPVKLHATPLDWLRASGEGICILDWDAPELHTLSEIHAIEVDDRKLGSRLISVLSRPARLPHLIVRSAVRHAA